MNFLGRKVHRQAPVCAGKKERKRRRSEPVSDGPRKPANERKKGAQKRRRGENPRLPEEKREEGVPYNYPRAVPRKKKAIISLEIQERKGGKVASSLGAKTVESAIVDEGGEKKRERSFSNRRQC